MPRSFPNKILKQLLNVGLSPFLLIIKKLKRFGSIKHILCYTKKVYYEKACFQKIQNVFIHLPGTEC